MIDSGTDTGDIIVRSDFEISPSELAVTLITRCIDEGIRLFPSVLEKLRAKNLSLQKQNKSKATYFSKRDLPYDGRFPLDEQGAVIDRYIRALSFAPLENNFFYPRVRLEGIDIYVRRISLKSYEGSSRSVGEIISFDKDRLYVHHRSYRNVR